MTRLTTIGPGFNTVTAGIEFTAVLTTAPAIETSIVRGTPYAYRISNAAAVEGFRYVHTSAQGAFYMRFYLYVVALPTLTSRVIGGFRSNGAYQITIRLTSAGLLQLYDEPENLQVGADSSAINTGEWYRIEVFGDCTDLASIPVEARAYAASDESTLLWNPSGTINLGVNPTNIACGTNGGDVTLDYIVADIAVNDTNGSVHNSWCGEGNVFYQFLNNNGDNSQWTGSDGNSTDNYLLVNENPPDDATTYVQSNTSGQIDDYEIDAVPAAVPSDAVITLVQVGVRGAVSDATGGDPDFVLRAKATSGGTVEESSGIDVNSTTYGSPGLSTSPSVYRFSLVDMPGASTTAITKADLDTWQIGIRESVTDTHFVRISTIWQVVEWKPAPAGGRTTKNTDPRPLGQFVGMSRTMINPPV